MNSKLAARILARREKSRKAVQLVEKELPTFTLDQFLFPEQLAFVRDPERYATACCSVRAGKTTACAADLIDTAINFPGTISCYITLARTSAERIVWPELKKINREYGLGGIPNEVKLSLRFPSRGNSTIYLFGANDEAEIEKIRGLSNVILVYLDESQAMRSHIKNLVEEIVAKRLYDTNGRCRMIGTPGPVLSGYYYDCCHSSQWSHHYWTMHQNPWILKKSGKTPEELIEQDCKRRGVSIDDPAIQRECFGRWKLDPDSLLLTYDPAINDYDELPQGKYTYILGIDLGTRDADSLSLLAFADNSPVTYLVEELLTPNQLTDDLAKQIKTLMAAYPIMAMPTDAGGLGLKIVEDIVARYGIPLKAADKREKLANYKHLNNALRTGIFKAKKTSRFAQDCNLLERDDDKSTPDRIVVKGHSDAVDSTLYGFKLSPAYAYVPPVQKPKPGSKEYDQMQEELHLQSALENVQKEKNMRDGKSEFGTWTKNKKGVPGWNEW